MTQPPRASRFPLGLEQVHPPSAPRLPGPATTVLRPQGPLQHAVDDAARRSAPSGLGMDSAAVRRRMVDRLRLAGMDCEPVLQAFASVERHLFVDSALATQAYEDTSLPIGLQQTISKPSVVARMLSLLFEGSHGRQHGHLGRVLEIGTGCGYQTALLSCLASSVLSIERLRPLHDKARDNLAGRRQGDVRLVYGDGRLGHAPRAPFHCIISAAGGEDLPEAWLEQLAEGGRLIAPSHDPTRGGQALLVVDRTPDGLARRWYDAVHFVPLKSGTQ